MLYDTTRPDELHFEDPRHQVIVVRLPRSDLHPHVANPQELTATTVPGACTAGHLLLTMIDTLRRDIEQLQPSSVMSISEGITSIFAARLRSLLSAH